MKHANAQSDHRRWARAMPPGSSPRGGADRARGAVLLEVLLALALLILGMAAVGGQINVGLKVAQNTEIATRAIMLAESKIAELDAGVLGFNPNDEFEGDFGRQYPGWGWRVILEPTDTDDLIMATLEVLYLPGVEFGDEPTVDEMQVVYTAYTLRAIPAVLDLQRDFGFTEDQLDEFAANIPMPGFDPLNIDPTAIAQLEGEELMEVLPMLMELLGSNSALLNSLPQSTQDQIKEAVDRHNAGEDLDTLAREAGIDADDLDTMGEAGGRPADPGRRGGPRDADAGDRGRLGGNRVGGERAGRTGRDEASRETDAGSDRRGDRRGPVDELDVGGDFERVDSRGGGRDEINTNRVGRRGGDARDEAAPRRGSGFRGSRVGSTAREDNTDRGPTRGGRGDMPPRSGTGGMPPPRGGRGGASDTGTRTGRSDRDGLSDPYRVPTEEDLYRGRVGGRR